MENKHLDNTDLQPRKWLLYVLIVVSIVVGVILATKIVTDNQNKAKDDFSIIDKFFDSFKDAVDKGQDIFDDEVFDDDDDDNNSYADEFEKKSFNSRLEMYVGTNWGNQVSSLIDVITTNNKTNPNRMLTVVFGEINTTDADEIRNIKKSLDDWDEYEIVLDYDENGFVHLITIEK